MKKLSVLIALGTAFFLQAASLYAADFKFEGDFRVRGIYANDFDADEDSDDQQAFADGRFRLKTTATAGIASAVVTLDFTNSFNDPNNAACPDPVTIADDPTTPEVETASNVGGASSCATGNYRFGSANFGNSYNIFGVREAYIRLDLNMVKLAFGRKPMKLGHSLVLDDTVDAVAAKFMAGPLNVMLANAKLLDSNTGGVAGRTGSDTDLYIAKFGLDHGDMHKLGFFAAYLNDRDRQFFGAGFPVVPSVPGFAVPGPDGDATLWAFGVTADGMFGAVNVAAEFDYFQGEIANGATTDLAGMNALLWLGVKVAAVDVGVAGVYTTGDDDPDDDEINVNGISGNFVLGNILINDNINSDREGQCLSVGGARLGSGGASCVGGSGVMGIKLSAGLEGVPFGKTCHTEVAAIWAQTTEDLTTTVIDPITGLPTTVTSDSDLGIEIDLNHRHKLDDNVAVALNLGYLLSGDFYGTDADNQVKGVLSLNYMF